MCERSVESLERSCRGAELIVVHSREIDDAGEADVGLATFETWIRQLETAWHHLRQIGVTDFVFSADHGFLLQDRTTEKRPWGSRRDPGRRHVLAPEARREEDLAVVSLAALGYEGRQGYLHFLRHTAVFATGKAGASFVHGGNSLQERVIPVLTVRHRQSPAKPMARYRIEAEPLPGPAGSGRLRLQLELEPDAQSILSFVATHPVGLALRVPERDDIRVDLKDAVGAELDNQQILLAAGRQAEVDFDLSGPADERVRIEIYHPEGTRQVEPRILDTLFDVAGTPGVADEAETTAETSWHQSFDDPGILRVFRHIETHGAVTEEELVTMLGSQRGVRRFALRFEEYADKVPFRLRIEVQATGKRYMKDF